MKKITLVCWIISSMSLSAQDRHCKGFNPNLRVIPGKPVKNLTIEEGIAICETNSHALTSTIKVLNHALALAKERNQQYRYKKPLPDIVDESNYASILRDREFTVETSEIIGAIHILDCYDPGTGVFDTVSRKGYLGEHWLNTFGFTTKSLACWNSNLGLPRLKNNLFTQKPTKTPEPRTTVRELAPSPQPQQVVVTPRARELAPPPPVAPEPEQAGIIPRELAPPPPADHDDCCPVEQVQKPALKPVVRTVRIPDPDTVIYTERIPGRVTYKECKKPAQRQEKPCDDWDLFSLCDNENDDDKGCNVSCCQPCCKTKRSCHRTQKTAMPATDALLGRRKTSSSSSKNSYSRLLLGL